MTTGQGHGALGVAHGGGGLAGPDAVHGRLAVVRPVASLFSAARGAGLTCGAEGLTRCGEASERLASHTDPLGLVWAKDGKGWASGWAEVGRSPRLSASQGHLVLPPPQPGAPCFVNAQAGASRSGSRAPRTQGPALLLSEQVGAGPDLPSVSGLAPTCRGLC